jgi:RNA polymerase sigma-70 factor (ECF subfamily)
VRVHGALSRFDPAGDASLSTWMLTIATRLALNELRQQKRPEPAHDEAETAAGDAADTPEAAVDRARMGATIARCMAQLPDDQRAILVLREYHDLDYPEIAAVLELELGTVKSRLSRARVALRERLVAAMPELARQGDKQ